MQNIEELPLQSASQGPKKLMSLAYDFAIARLQQATQDCAFIFFNDIARFSENVHRYTTTDIMAKERDAMIDWLHSDDFEGTCELANQDDNLVREGMLKILHTQKGAARVLAEYGLKIISLCVIFIFTALPASPDVPFPALNIAPVILPYETPDLVSLEKITDNPIAVRVRGKIQIFKTTVFTYKDKDGNKIELPVLVPGVINNAVKHPRIQGLANHFKKVEPILVIGAAVAQILTACRL